jgi:choline-sulfatase
MSGRLRRLVALAPLVAGLGCEAARNEPSVSRLNLLLITIDTLRADRVGAIAAPTGVTPAIDTWARDAIVFEQAYTTAPLTLPAHVAMMSGRLPIAHTVRTNDGRRVPDDVPLVADALKRAGFHTAAFVGAAVLDHRMGLARGFEVYDDDVGPTGERRAEAVVARTLAWLERAQQPFFAWVHLYDPHLDYDPPEPYRARFAGREYDGEVAYTDASVGRLFEALDRSNLTARTAVIVAGDHGESLGEHGERSHGALLFEGATRVPLIVRVPSARAARVAAPVSTMAIAPTLLQLAGVSRSAGLSGPRSAEALKGPPYDQGATGEDRFEPLIDSTLAPRLPVEPVLMETLYLRQLLGWSPVYAIRRRNLKLVDGGTPQLYDVAADYREQRDRAATDADAVKTLRRLLETELTGAAGRKATAVAGDPAAAERIAALGYASGGPPVDGFEPPRGVDPATRMPLWQTVERALEAAHKGDKREAARLFTTVRREDPDNALALKFLGAAALDAGDLPRAVELNERLVARGLHVADAEANLVLAYHRLRRAADAERAAERAIAADPNHAAARFNLATHYWESGNAAAAKQALEPLLARFPDHAGGRTLMAAIDSRGAALAPARALIDRQEFGAACAMLRDLSRTATASAEAFDLLGIACLRAGNEDEARRAFERAVALAPAQPDAIERLAALLHRQGDRRRARSLFGRALELDPGRQSSALSLAILDVEEGHADRATRRLEPLLNSDWPGARAAQCYYGRALATQGETAAARRALETCIRQAPQDPLALDARRRLEALK